MRRTLTYQIYYEIELDWRPDAETYVEPDILIFSGGFEVATVPPAEVLLLIEVFHSSLADDKKLKASVYAALGVREYWIVNAVTLETTVYRAPSASGYSDVKPYAGTSILTAAAIPGASLRPADLNVA